jgi:hypothetical protein
MAREATVTIRTAAELKTALEKLAEADPTLRR